MAWPLRAALVLPCLLLGAFVGLCAVLLHQHWWGMLLGLAATAALLAALPAGWWARLPAATGWVVVLAVAAAERPEGDYLLAGDLAGYLLLGAGVAVFGGGFVGLLGRRVATEDSRGAPPPT